MSIRKLLFWLDCLDRGENPWHVEAENVEELEALRASRAQELERALIAKLRDTQGDNVGTDSKVAQGLIRAGVRTHITTVLGHTIGRTYTLEYDRVGYTEFIRIRIDGVFSLYPVAMLVSSLTLRQQRQVRRFLT